MINSEPQNIEEQNLWISFIQGDDASLEILYRRYFDELYNYGKKWLNDALLTEDAIQDLFIKLMKNRSTLSPTTSVRYYLFRSFRSMVLDKIKKNNRMQMIDEPGEHLFLFELSPEKLLVEEQDSIAMKEKLAAALHSLTPRQREAVYLRYIGGFSYAEVAEAMELTAKGTYKLMARAIEALKDQLLGVTILTLIRILFYNN
jgi:RNA polymerase sigma factor (sigma-70 family)